MYFRIDPEKYPKKYWAAFNIQNDQYKIVIYHLEPIIPVLLSLIFWKHFFN